MQYALGMFSSTSFQVWCALRVSATSCPRCTSRPSCPVAVTTVPQKQYRTLNIARWTSSMCTLRSYSCSVKVGTCCACEMKYRTNLPSPRRWRDCSSANVKVLRLSQHYTVAQSSLHSILEHGTLYRLHGSFNTGTIWGDYYLLESLNRGIQKCKHLAPTIIG